MRFLIDKSPNYHFVPSPLNKYHQYMFPVQIFLFSTDRYGILLKVVCPHVCMYTERIQKRNAYFDFKTSDLFCLDTRNLYPLMPKLNSLKFYGNTGKHLLVLFLVEVSFYSSTIW